MDFKSSVELLELCRQTQCPISEVMRRRECELGETTRDQVDHRMAKVLEIMRASATQPLKKPSKSMGGLIGGESKKLYDHAARGKAICGDILQRAMTYAMGVAEVNASMGLIVAAPTAGSAGISRSSRVYCHRWRRRRHSCLKAGNSSEGGQRCNRERSGQRTSGRPDRCGSSDDPHK